MQRRTAPVIRSSCFVELHGILIMFNRLSVASLLTMTAILAASPVTALTFKKGQVLGSDGQVYDGASPEQRDNIIARAAES